MKWNDINEKQPFTGQKVRCRVISTDSTQEVTLQFYVCPEYLTPQWDDLDGKEFPHTVTHWTELPK